MDTPAHRVPASPGAATSNVPRPEHPRPRLRRERWRNLNGPWEFAIDDLDPAPARERGGEFPLTITVPFAPESRASGIGRTGFMPSVWYRRRVDVPADWFGTVPMLRIGAADFHTRVFVDGALAGEHWGGSTRIDVDLSPFAGPGESVEVVLHCRDDVRTGLQPGGKQSSLPHSHGCFYTRVTGVWQTVWLEGVPKGGLDDLHVQASAATRTAVLTPRLRPSTEPRRWRARLLDGDAEVARSESLVANGLPMVLDVPEARAWCPGDPALYDLEIDVLGADGRTVDRVHSYVGFRDVEVRGAQVLLNGEPWVQRLVLDQGYWPDSLWTAPSDAALRHDVEMGQALGFDGARLHQKVFEPRYHYWADRLGYLTWAESPSWGLDLRVPEAARNFLTEWADVVGELRSHPSIVAWTPFNETDPGAAADPQQARAVADAAALTRALDPTRPVNDASGWVHVDTDLWTVHHYTQDPVELDRLLTPYPDIVRNEPTLEPAYGGQPLLVDEFGGIKWIPEGDAERPDDWGYGDDPATVTDFLARLDGLLGVVRRHRHVVGWCYTQLTDVEQERNGLLDAERRPKFDLVTLRRIIRGDDAL
jgi:beta-galactosidase/beta-glucuronidase